MPSQRNAEALAVWLANNQPELFENVLRTARGASLAPPRGFAGLTDFLSTIGTSVGSAVKNVGSFLATEDGMKTLGTVGGLYLQSQMQRDALRVQLATVQAGYAPLPIQNVGASTNTSVPVYQPTGEALSPSLARQLTPPASILQNWPWALAFAAGFALLWSFKPR